MSEEKAYASWVLNANLSEKFLKEGPGECVPGDRVGDGCENPVELPEGRLPVGLLTGNAVYQVTRQTLAAEQALGTEPAQGNLQAGVQPCQLNRFPLAMTHAGPSIAANCQSSKGVSLEASKLCSVRTSNKQILLKVHEAAQSVRFQFLLHGLSPLLRSCATGFSCGIGNGMRRGGGNGMGHLDGRRQARSEHICRQVRILGEHLICSTGSQQDSVFHVLGMKPAWVSFGSFLNTAVQSLPWVLCALALQWKTMQTQPPGVLFGHRKLLTFGGHGHSLCNEVRLQCLAGQHIRAQSFKYPRQCQEACFHGTTHGDCCSLAGAQVHKEQIKAEWMPWKGLTLALCSANCLYELTIMPAAEQSNT